MIEPTSLPQALRHRPAWRRGTVTGDFPIGTQVAQIAARSVSVARAHRAAVWGHDGQRQRLPIGPRRLDLPAGPPHRPNQG